MLILYTDDTKIPGLDLVVIQSNINEIFKLYEITTKEEIAVFIGVNINVINNGEIILTLK